MRILISLIVLTSLISCSEARTNKLEEKEETIELTYIAWACDCANWAPIEELKKYNPDNPDSPDSLAKMSIFIEHADILRALPDTIGYTGDIIELTGKFYKEKGFPKDYESFENPDKAREFRYTSYKIVKSTYNESKTDTTDDSLND